MDFVDTEVVLLDRSTLERFATCPQQAVLIDEVGDHAGLMAAAGEEAHQAVSRVIQVYLESGGNMTRNQLLEVADTEFAMARPDVMAEVCKISRQARWAVASMLAEISPSAILKFDGGQGEQSGQVAQDVEVGDRVYRCTSEVDFLRATASPEVIHEIDWKSGWKPWTFEAVLDEFQFRFHWWLLAEEYPEVEELRIQVYDVRRGNLTKLVSFDRGDLPGIHSQVLSAVEAYDKWNGNPSAPAWPFAEKCRICPVSQHCVAAAVDRGGYKLSPSELVNRLVAMQAAEASIKKQLTTYRNTTGEDIVSENGNCFGLDKPKSTRKPTMSTYTRKTSDDESEDDNE